MTSTDQAVFSQCFNVLSVSLPGKKTDDGDELAANLQVYFQALEDLPLDAVRASVQVIQRQGSGFFPSTQEWHSVAERLTRDRAVEARLLAGDIDTDAFECRSCHDTGFVTSDSEHGYSATRCSCVPLNHTIQRRVASAGRR